MNSTQTPDREYRAVFRGGIAAFMADETRYIDLEGAFRCGKTTAACHKVAKSCLDHPGIQWLVCRWTDSDTHGILKPVWRRTLDAMGVVVQWDGSEHCDVFPNGPDPAEPYKGGSRVYIRGLKPQQETSRYGKLRGMTLAGVYNDQTEELPHDFFLELKGRLSQRGMPHQLLLTPNPEFAEDHWLAREFPEANNIIDHKHYSVSIYENAHNLESNVIPDLERAYPPEGAKHRPAILGRRGVKVLGRPVYAGYFKRAIHESKVEVNPHLPLCEAIDFGKHHPCVVWCQFTPHGGVHILGAVMGLDLFIEDFAPMVLAYRTQWFPNPLEVLTCCDPAGSHNNSQGVRKNGVSVLRDHGFAPRWLDNSNALDVRKGAVERLGGYMHRRSMAGEAFQINGERQVIVTASDLRYSKFLTDGFEAGYVWDPHTKSVGGKPMTAPLKDGWYEHGQNCCEYLEINFGGAQPSVRDMERRAGRVAAQALRAAQQDPHETFRWNRPTVGRGGYR